MHLEKHLRYLWRTRWTFGLKYFIHVIRQNPDPERLKRTFGLKYFIHVIRQKRIRFGSGSEEDPVRRIRFGSGSGPGPIAGPISGSDRVRVRVFSLIAIAISFGTYEVCARRHYQFLSVN